MVATKPLPAVLTNEAAPVATASNPATFIRVISGLTVTLVALLSVCSFVLSFEALQHFASESGALNHGHAWLFPIMVDGSIIVFSISALRCSIMGEDTRWSMWLVVISTGASILFNIAHAPGGFMPALIGATPPVLLFLSFESFMRQINSSLGGQHSSLTALLPSIKRKAFKKAGQANTTKPQFHQSVDSRKVKASELLALGMPKRQVARESGLGLATVRKLAAVAVAHDA